MADPMDTALRQHVIEELHAARTGYGIPTLTELTDLSRVADLPEPAELPEPFDRTSSTRGGESVTESFLRSPSCGDEIRVRVTVRDEVITGLAWQGHGCVVSTAAASALARLAPGTGVQRFAELAAAYSDSVWTATEPDGGIDLEDAAVFAGFGRIPLRGRCATLAWNAASAALSRAAADDAA